MLHNLAITVSESKSKKIQIVQIIDHFVYCSTGDIAINLLII